jgi:DNA-binding NtrC family response regulator
MIRKALVADDEPMDRELLQEGLGCVGADIEVLTACDGAEACELAESQEFDVVFADLCMPRKDGIDVLKRVSGISPGTEVVIVTGHAEVPTAVKAVKMGCFDYLQKPITVDEVEEVIQRLNRCRGPEEGTLDIGQGPVASDKNELIGRSAAFRRVCNCALQVAPTDATVLLQGESGTGKELLSRLVHRASSRADGPFIRLNCAALSDSLLESELFGHTKGAFTGAHEARPGRFELADGGTLMLDEITETSEKLQAELLRAIEEKEFERVGGTSTIEVDVRIIATTNRDMEEEVSEGRFREDLYYRLNVVPIDLPPLREREGDIPLLARYFARRFSRQLGRRCPEFTPDAIRKLEAHSWPGNVRELQNLIQRVLIMRNGTSLCAEDFPARLSEPGARFSEQHGDGPRTLEEIERHAILKSIEEADGNKTLAAEKLGISARTVWNKLKKYKNEGVLPEDFA